jgi:hypothetical protein
MQNCEIIDKVIETIGDNFYGTMCFNQSKVARLIEEPLYEANIPCDIHSGASRVCIVLPNCDYVIKIPFTEYFLEGSYERHLEWFKDGKLDQEPDEKDFHYPFECAYSNDLNLESSWDYCAYECALYEEAHFCGLAQYFAAEEFYAEPNGYPIYIQQKATLKDDEDKVTKLSNAQLTSTYNTCSHEGLTCFDDEWITIFIDTYGLNEFKKLSEFLDKFCIEDLHGGNIGFLNGAPILFDYANYNE